MQQQDLTSKIQSKNIASEHQNTAGNKTATSILIRSCIPADKLGGAHQVDKAGCDRRKIDHVEVQTAASGSAGSSSKTA